MMALGRVADQVHFAPFFTLSIAQSSYAGTHRLWQRLLPPSMWEYDCLLCQPYLQTIGTACGWAELT